MYFHKRIDMKVTLKFEGVEPKHLGKIHEIADEAKVTFGADRGRFANLVSHMKVTKSQLGDNDYTLYVTVQTIVVEPGDIGARRTKKKVSIASIREIFSVLDIFPEKEKEC